MLTPAQNQRLLELFELAANVAPADRNTFVDEQCRDDDVRRELKALFDIERAGLGSFLREPLRPAGLLAVGNGSDEPEQAYDSEEFMTPRPPSTSGNEADRGSGMEPDAIRQLTQQKRYQLAGEISRGGMGVILRGQDSEFRRPVAIKVMRRELLDSPYLVHRFVEEAQINGRLQHPGIVPVYDMGLRTDQLPYFSMKLIEGRTLGQLLDERPDAIELLGVFEQVCQAVAYAHNRGVVHRDLKPANIMVGAFGEVHVLDWGVAKIVDRQAHGLASNHGNGAVGGNGNGNGAADQVADQPSDVELERLQSRCGTVIGTLPYMPPEQARGELTTLGPTADVFALGAMICQLLTGRPAYVGNTAEMYDCARRGDLQSATDALASCSADPELIALANDCLRPDPSERPQDASVVALRIRDYLRSIEERRQQAEIETAEAKVLVAQERRARKLTFALTSTVAAVVLTVGLTIAWWNGQRREREARITAMVEAGIADASRALDEQRHGQAALQVSNTEALLRSPDAAPEMRALAAPRLADIELQAKLALDNARLLTELENIRMPERGSPGAPEYRPTDWVAIDAAYQTRFAAAGMDPDLGSVADAAQRVLARRAPDAWAPILDEWSMLRVWAGDTDGSLRLSQVADLVDGEPARTELRHAMRKGDGEALLTHAASDELRRHSANTLNLLAFALQQSGERATAIRVLRTGCRQHAANFSLHMNLSRVLMSSEQPEAAEAARHYLAACALRPDNPEARHELARTLHMFLGQNERAESILRDMLARGPEDAHILYHLGYVQSQLGQHEQAIASLQRSLELQPGDAACHNSLGHIYLAQRKRKQAIESYRAAIEHDPSAMAYKNLGIALQRSGQLDEARAALERSLELDAGDPDTHSALGIVASRQGRHEDSLKHFQAALAIDDQVPDYHTNLGYALAWVKGADEAFAAYDEALRLDPDFVKAHYNVGTLNLNLGRLEQAEQALEECLRCEPRYRDVYAALCAMFWDKDWRRVAAYCDRGIEAIPRDKEFYEWLGCARGNLSEHEQAITAYQRLIALDDRYPEAHLNLGKQYRALARYHEALQSFEKARTQTEGDGARAIDALIAKTRADLARIEPLERILAGELPSQERDQLLAAAELAYVRRAYATCVELHALALATSGEPLDRTTPAHARAVRAAALVAAGQGSDAAELADEQLLAHRQRASAWLRQLVDAWRAAAGDDAATRRRGDETLAELLQTPQLQAIRGADALAHLPDDERQALAELWRQVDEVRELLQR